MNLHSSVSPPKSFAMASGGVKLAQEIHDEFLCCKICLEGYKNPKSLSCLHTFCENCIENHVSSESTYKKYSDYRDFTCPLCRKRTQLPIGGVKKLPDNFLVSSLSEVIVRQKPSKFPFCDICKMVNRKHREAASKCLDCAKLLCKQCVEMHKETKVTSNHSIFDVEIEKDIECKEHQDEVVRFYCEPCETCICVLCTFNEHKDHDITQFGEAVAKYKDNIQDMLTCCSNKIEKFDNQIEALNAVEDTIKTTEQQVHDTALQFISEIRAREKQLVDEIHTIYGNDLMEYIENKKDLGTTVEGLRSTCNLTEVILKGKDIELLLLKKDVQKKLQSLGDIEIKNLPPTIKKKINFIVGDIELGVIQDMDRPALTKIRNKMKRSSDEEVGPEAIEQVSKETQTEGQVKVLSKPRKNTNTDDSDDDDEDESDSDSDSEDSSSDEDDKKPETKEEGVQTEPQESSSDEDSESDDETTPPVETKDQGTATDLIPTEEKAVNTRSRSLQGQQMRRSPPKDDSHESSLAARRRQRRERNQYRSLDLPDHASDSFTNEDAHITRPARSAPPQKQYGSTFRFNNAYGDDFFYDAQ